MGFQRVAATVERRRDRILSPWSRPIVVSGEKTQMLLVFARESVTWTLKRLPKFRRQTQCTDLS